MTFEQYLDVHAIELNLRSNGDPIFVLVKYIVFMRPSIDDCNAGTLITFVNGVEVEVRQTYKKITYFLGEKVT